MGPYADTLPGQYLGSYGTGKDERSCNTAGEMTAPTVIIVSVIPYLAAVIGMTGPHHMTQLVVIPAVLIRIAYQDTQRSSCRMIMEITAFDFKGIGFLPCRRHGIPSGSTTGHFLPYSIPVYRNTSRKPVEDSPDGISMGFSKNCQSCMITKGIIHCCLPPPYTFHP